MKDEVPVTPERELADFGRAFSGIWAHVDQQRLDPARGSAGWPRWCYLPYERARQIMENFRPGLPAEIEQLAASTPELRLESARRVLAYELCLLSAWRHTKGVYRFDPDIYEMVNDTEIDRDLPCELLQQLPEWCVTIETPGLRMRDTPKSYVMVTTTQRAGESIILLNCNLFCPIIVPLARQSIADALEHAQVTGELQEVYEPFVRRALCLAIFLCCDEPDVSQGIDRRLVKPTKTRHGLRFFPPEKVQQWTVGERMGATLRFAAREWEAMADNTPEEQLAEGEGSRRARPRPHARKAHFRRVYYGSRDNPRCVWKWFPSTLVNARSPEQLIKTVHPVTE